MLITCGQYVDNLVKMVYIGDNGVCMRLQSKKMMGSNNKQVVDRCCLRAYRVMVEQDSKNVTAESLKKRRDDILKLADETEDDRVRINCHKLIDDMDSRIAKMEWQLFEHQNPAVQKSEIEHKGLPEIPTTLQIQIVSGGK
jgi:hypothetical protein